MNLLSRLRKSLKESLKDKGPVNPMRILDPGFHDQDRLSTPELEKTFPDPISKVFVGAPFVGAYGSRVHGKCGKCVQCNGDIQEVPAKNNMGDYMMQYCPGCRKQLYKGIDTVGNPNYNQNLDGGQIGFGFTTPQPDNRSFEPGAGATTQLTLN